MRCQHHFLLFFAVTILGTLCSLISTSAAASALNRNDKIGAKYEGKSVSHVLMRKRDLRRAHRSQENENVILSNKMDANIMEKLGNMKMRHASAERWRRHQSPAEVKTHNNLKTETKGFPETKIKDDTGKSVGSEHSQVNAAVEENDSLDENRPKPIGHLTPGKGHAAVSEFEWPSSAFENSVGGHSDKNSGGQGHHSNIASETGGELHYDNFADNGNSDGTAEGTADVDTPIKQLIDQSTDLAKETRVVFQVIAAREDYLVKQMEGFKHALRNAIEIIQDMAKENKLRYKRWDRAGEASGPGPYKACVYVEPSERIEQPELTGRNSYSPPEKVVQEPQYIEYPTVPVTQEPKINRASDDIDLSSIYWLKLPQDQDSSSMDPKIQGVLNEVRQSGRDAILVPVLKGFTNAEDLAKGFLRAVRVNPADFQSSSIRIRRVV